MSSLHPKLLGSYRHTFTTGLTTGVVAGTATAGHILALRYSGATEGALIRSLEVEAIVTTAFGAAQRVGYDAVIARGYTAAHTDATALTVTLGKVNAQFRTPTLAGRIAGTGALTAGTHTLDTNPVAKGSFYASAIGLKLGPILHDFTAAPQGGLLLAHQEGLVVRNTIAMGATGVVEWIFTVEWDELEIA